MKNLLRGYVFLYLLVPFSNTYISAQCNVNDKYDKIISGYHSSIALKDNGVYAVWGSYMQSTGSADQLSPQDLTVTYYPAITGTIYKTALGGKNAGAQVDQAFVLTSTGLWAWGVAGNVVSTGVKSGNTFGRTSTVSGNGFNTYGLPSTIIPTEVASLFATYQTLILLTTSGNVWILTQTNQTVEANGGATTTAGSGSNQWKQVKINSSTFLTNVTAVRGQVSSNVYNAFIAVTSTGAVYTWGNSSYSGSGASAARNYATLMTIPSEFSSSIPKMIGVTGGITTTATTKNTYYLLSNAGNLYSLGDNTQRQCGDFTTTERTSWVQVKKSAAANDYLTNVNFFSCQEHNSSYPATAAITTSGNLYTWGNNSSGMCGRTDNGLSNGTLNTVSFDPAIPVGFTGTAVSVEMGGHTMVYLKEGSSQFCYVGHYTNGSMGDGTSGNNGSSTATSLKHDCNSTPVISICGSVPVAGSTVTSTINTSLSSIEATGLTTSTITIQLKNAGGVNLTTSGGIVAVSSTAGSLGTVTDNNNGSYTVILTSSASPAIATIGFSINGTAANSTTQVEFTSGTLPLSWLHVQAYRQNKNVRISWTTAAEVNVKNFDIERSFTGNDWGIIIAGIPASSRAGTNQYEQTDTAFNPKKLFYRIRQQDIDGRYSYSLVQKVPAVSDINNITVYPVPANNSFHLDYTSPDKIKKIQLIAVNGTLLKTWTQFQSSYDIHQIPAGNYLLRVETSDDILTLKLKKQ